MSGADEVDCDEVKPNLLYSKFQRLKNTTNSLARVLIIDEKPLPQKMTHAPTIKGKTTQDTVGGDLKTRLSQDSLDESLASARNTQRGQPQVQAILYYPEKLHTVNR